jgi:hypothetical protein
MYVEAIVFSIHSSNRWISKDADCRLVDALLRDSLVLVPSCSVRTSEELFACIRDAKLPTHLSPYYLSILLLDSSFIVQHRMKFRRKSTSVYPISSTKRSSSSAAVPPKLKTDSQTTTTLEDIHVLVAHMLESDGEKSEMAAKRIYELCDIGNKENRVPMVCSGKFGVIAPLAQCLTTKNSGKVRRLACLTLNNLSIPIANKRYMSFGPSSKLLIDSLCKVIAEDQQDSYLCCICVMNLAAIEDSITMISRHSPSPEGKPIPPIDNPNSLVCIVEKILVSSTSLESRLQKSKGILEMVRNLPVKEVPRKQEVFSCVDNEERTCSTLANPQLLRWACGLIKNLARNEDSCSIISKTDIPKCLLEMIRSSAVSPRQWLPNEKDDFALFALLHLAEWPVSREVLLRANAKEILRPIMLEGGSQGLKATMACAFLNTEWTHYPKGRYPAAQTVYELINNIVEKKGKEGHYPYGVFKLRTATKAYRNLAMAAALEGDTKALTFPSVVAMMLQIISDVVVSSMEAGSDRNKIHPDSVSAEYALQTFDALLPSILQQVEPARKSHRCKKAAGEISVMLVTYADLTAAGPMAKDLATRLQKCGSVSRPILEIAHELWRQYLES